MAGPEMPKRWHRAGQGRETHGGLSTGVAQGAGAVSLRRARAFTGGRGTELAPPGGALRGGATVAGAGSGRRPHPGSGRPT